MYDKKKISLTNQKVKQLFATSIKIPYKDAYFLCWKVLQEKKNEISAKG